MFLKKLTLLNFKNYESAQAELSEAINCFVGDNGSGKTNLLEAVYYLSLCKSCFNIPDLQNIKIGEQFFMIDGDFHIKDETEKIICAVQEGLKKKFSRNKKEYTRLSDHIGLIPAVLSTPSDTQLVYAASDERRRFLNGLISQHDRAYLQNVIDYNKALEQRNRLLKNFAQTNTWDELALEIWDETMSQTGEKIFESRKELIDKLKPVFQKYYSFISGDNEEVSLVYKSDLENGSLKELLNESRQADRFAQRSTIGIHRDDLVFLIGDRNIKKTGSQGQQKTYLVALKFGQFDLIKGITSKKPLLLLDDVFDKLDAGRVERIISLVAEENFGQIFITDANKVRVDKVLEKVSSDHRIFKVQAGKLELVDK
ncbi:MAG: DNA replication and repair protein RecF [Salinivirgaceae bacterium]|nr:MAG: DNA replication and repair protein RecF [Salinivirgaceae bacterium]